jgi:hypothetical protein
MKKVQFLILCFIAHGFFSSYAQENTEYFQELGLNSTNLTSGYGFTYNWGKSDFLWSLRAMSLTGGIPLNKPDSINYTNAVGGYSTVYTSTSANYGVGVNFGFEKYSHLTEKLSPYWGINGSLSYQYTASKNWNSKTTNYTIQPGIGLRLGVMYAITQKIYFRADINPNISYSLGKQINYFNTRENIGPDSYQYSTPTKKLNLSLSNSGVTFTISYRFLKK